MSQFETQGQAHLSIMYCWCPSMLVEIRTSKSHVCTLQAVPLRLAGITGRPPAALQPSTSSRHVPAIASTPSQVAVLAPAT